MKQWPIMTAILMLTGAWGLVWSLSYAEVVPAKDPFSTFPLSVNQRWEGRELGLEQSIVNQLKVNDYMMRIYLPQAAQAGQAAPEPAQVSKAVLPQIPVWLYVGYYQSQRTGATYHSPKNCLPGAGWQVTETELIPVTLPDQTRLSINRVMVQKGLDKQVILYWYQDRGRVVASEYWAKAYLMWDALTRHRTDGALVRISIPVVTTGEAATQHGVAFLQDSWPLLQTYLPGDEAV